MTTITIAALLLAAVGTGLAVRAGHHRWLIARLLELRPTVDVPPAFDPPDDDAPLVAPDLHLPAITGRYAQLGLLGASPVERDTVARLAEQDAVFAALMDDLRDPEWEAQLLVACSVPPQWDNGVRLLGSSWDAALAGVAGRHERARRNLLDVQTWDWWAVLPNGERLALTGATR